MITQEQAILLAEEKAQADFPVYQPGPVLTAEDEQDCYYMRLYQYPQRSRSMTAQASIGLAMQTFQLSSMPIPTKR